MELNLILELFSLFRSVVRKHCLPVNVRGAMNCATTNQLSQMTDIEVS